MTERGDELERRWRQSGACDDEAAWLAERLRRGQLSAAALELAARLGYRAARLALGRDDDPPLDLLDFHKALWLFQPHALHVSAAFAAARCTLERLPDPRGADLLRRAEALFEAPTAELLAREELPNPPLEEPEEPGERVGDMAHQLALTYGRWRIEGSEIAEDAMPYDSWRVLRMAAWALEPGAIADPEEEDDNEDWYEGFQGRRDPELQAAVLKAVIARVLEAPSR